MVWECEREEKVLKREKERKGCGNEREGVSVSFREKVWE